AEAAPAAPARCRSRRAGRSATAAKTEARRATAHGAGQWSWGGSSKASVKRMIVHSHPVNGCCAKAFGFESGRRVMPSTVCCPGMGRSGEADVWARAVERKGREGAQRTQRKSRVEHREGRRRDLFRRSTSLLAAHRDILGTTGRIRLSDQ